MGNDLPTGDRVGGRLTCIVFLWHGASWIAMLSMVDDGILLMRAVQSIFL